ncbi:histidinol-phosphatase HisJ family protein [Virgibacillus dakarensis]|uniref:histidinol-phosphatase HisJ family protein n=1 Tax=Virgibacillus dakarensis TaxID=1917889 RepID=UPI000B443664|nr:histidinol-phosphatase HisJ family protein [Virgibacillus dakarensis]MBT2214783.1 histidinol-phosphatase HisJ family protein [Virgibacillus dakarensis]
MFDYHVHSTFSADCDTPMEESIKKAIEIGLKEICFTDHIDYDYPDRSIIFDLDLAQYNRKLTKLQEKYAKQITIKKGVEIGVQPHLLSRYSQLTASETFDFVICSMHTTNKQDLHSGEFFTDKSVDEAYTAYYNELLYCVKHYKQYQVLGHLDLVKRYTRERATKGFREVIAEIFKVIIPEGKGIELNTSGVRYGLESGMPSADILKVYKELGGEIITLGSDSHTSRTIAFQFNDALALLQTLGFRYITTFEKGKAKQHPIEGLSPLKLS